MGVSFPGWVEERVAATERWAQERFQGLEASLDHAVAVGGTQAGGGGAAVEELGRWPHWELRPVSEWPSNGRWAEQRLGVLEGRIEAWGAQVSLAWMRLARSASNPFVILFLPRSLTLTLIRHFKGPILAAEALGGPHSAILV